MTGIYRITNLINNKVYIGQSINIENRFLRHRNELRRNKQNNSYLQNAWNKYGEKNFEFAILEVCTEEELDDKECAYIQLFNSMNRDNGYNLESGGHQISICQMIAGQRCQRLKRVCISEKIIQCMGYT